jgi:hypothetical protein
MFLNALCVFMSHDEYCFRNGLDLIPGICFFTAHPFFTFWRSLHSDVLGNGGIDQRILDLGTSWR